MAATSKSKEKNKKGFGFWTWTIIILLVLGFLGFITQKGEALNASNQAGAEVDPNLGT
jgi:hypothetical protein